MKGIVISAALIITCAVAPAYGVNECPEGKSEVVLVTPSGISKTICVANAAVSGVENAAEHAAIDLLPAVCPCEDVWDGSPYPDNTDVFGTPPTLQQDLTMYTCNFREVIMSTIIEAIEIVNATQETHVFRAEHGSVDGCVASTTVTGQGTTGYAKLKGESGSFFPDEVPQDGIINDSGLEACKQLFVDRGCTFSD